MLAVALDVVAALEMDLRVVAEVLGCSSSQLVQFVKLEPSALGWMNVQRAHKGRHPLK